MPFGGIGSALVGAAGSIAGGLLGNASRTSPADHFADNAALQKEFAQNGIRWKVADAKAAGLHPLAALGAQTTAYTPGYVGDTGSQNDYSFLGEAGQQIGRAIDAKSTAEERARNRVYQEKANELQLENMQLQNDAIKQDMVRQLARDAERSVNTQNQVPAMPGATSGVIPGQAQSYPTGLTEEKPPEIASSMPSNSGIEAGTSPDLRFTRTAHGGYAPVRSQALEEALEDDLLGSIGWNVRNLLPAVAYDSSSSAPPKSLLPDKGRTGKWIWTFNPFHSTYYPVRRDSLLDRVNNRFNPLR